MEVACVLLLSLITIIIIDLLMAKKWAMSEKVDKGIMVCYWRLSYRRKFIRTLWLIPIAIIVILIFYYKSHSLFWTCLLAVIVAFFGTVQAFYNYKKWKDEM